MALQVGIKFQEHTHVVVEDLQVLRYEVAQHYHTHHDYFDPVLHHGFLAVSLNLLSKPSAKSRKHAHTCRCKGATPAGRKLPHLQVWV